MAEKTGDAVETVYKFLVLVGIPILFGLGGWVLYSVSTLQATVAAQLEVDKAQTRSLESHDRRIEFIERGRFTKSDADALRREMERLQKQIDDLLERQRDG